MRPRELTLIASLLTSGCPVLTEHDLAQRMDLDGDGVPRPTDCDDDDASIGAEGGWFQDTDGDGYGGSLTDACTWEEGLVATGGDCDDTDAAVHPDAEERCNEADDDCDSLVDEGAALSTWYYDADGDGHGAADTTAQACFAPDGYVAAMASAMSSSEPTAPTTSPATAVRRTSGEDP